MIEAVRKRALLREGLAGSRPVVMVGAHDAMSAHLVESYGFDAVWVSGFGVSTMTYAVPDLNLITMTDTLQAAVRIDAATRLPVVADCDNGFGSLNNVVRTVQEFDRAGIAGVCIEDNLFPKRNSLLADGGKRELLAAEEQARRLRAAIDARPSDDFVVIARVEALIAGHGVEAACERADAYADAGADAILIHSKDRSLAEIDGFLESWQGLGKVPLVAVPTLFPDRSAPELYDKGFQMIILANQLMRASVGAMERTLSDLRDSDGRAVVVDPAIAAVNHVFELVGTADAIAAEDGPAT
jgi:phosphoenolpyruvate phosphomutase